ncbi:hypothetical protein Pan258_25840 [Symmachiella dynata]|uniref:tetratricopeptide repeat protein n=1 Tax=Symmachiella dynata TaxID=2527995 RepID=UPI00118CC663|nr:hypothetical protein [Symmachiella dynata]QDT48542.1 hypothetical protein Pan258_25840 [Symmachiella dynata]
MRALIISLTISIFLTTAVGAEEASNVPRSPNSDSRDRAAAVALNYCRAAFFRIKRNGTKPVLVEEQENILNNLNLNGIADQEVVTLYTKVLEEIGGETIAEKERQHLKSEFRRNLGRQAMASAFLLSTQVTTFQYGEALRTGAGSWWDYRNLKTNTDHAVWNIEKSRMVQVVNSSSQFLDTFWKMIQKKNIPDRWLIRCADLDSLDAALNETDPEIRLRLLQRLEKFMECYPPYWYHVARTHQALGDWDKAAETYENLANYGAGHFRRDEMLAAGVANLAAIQDFQGNREAARTAQEALGYADTAWQANLVCARILAKHGKYELAEEAALRNIDARLERTQSLVALMTIYQDSGEREKLIHWLRDEQVLGQIPVPAVLRACTYLGSDEVPTMVNRHLLRTLFGYADMNLGMDDIVFRADPLWQIGTAKVSLLINGRTVHAPELGQKNDAAEVRFRDAVQLGGIFSSTPRSTKIALVLKYPHMQPTVLHLRRVPSNAVTAIWQNDDARQPSQLGRRGGNYLVSDIKFEGRQLSLIRYGRPTRSGGRLVKTSPTQPAPSKVADDNPITPPTNPFLPASSKKEIETETKPTPTIKIGEVTPITETKSTGTTADSPSQNP